MAKQTIKTEEAGAKPRAGHAELSSHGYAQTFRGSAATDVDDAAVDAAARDRSAHRAISTGRAGDGARAERGGASSAVAGDQPLWRAAAGATIGRAVAAAETVAAQPAHGRGRAAADSSAARA